MTRNVDRDLELLWEQFHATVNMTSAELRSWLLTTASGEEAFTPDPNLDLDELGRGVLHVLGKRRTDLTREDTEVMSRVVELVGEWAAQQPGSAGPDGAAWRHRLMSIGHDPLKER
jgi:Protein of unknown function (DUF3140)